jgi:hypothetical protein
VVVEYPIEESGFIKFYLAPKIDDDNAGDEWMNMMNEFDEWIGMSAPSIHRSIVRRDSKKYKTEARFD